MINKPNPRRLSSHQQSHAADWSKWVGAAAIALITWVVYTPSMQGGFIIDDSDLLTKNLLIHSPNGLQRLWFSTEPQDYWPVTSTMFWFEWRLWGLNPIGYHLANVAIHIAASLLLWRLLNRLAIPGAFLAAFLFAVHPVNVESVAWIAQRKNVLAMLFYLLAILSYLRAFPTPNEPLSSGMSEHRSFITIWYGLSCLCFLLGMLSKGSIAILPVVLLLLAWWRRAPIVRELLRLLPFLVIAAVLTMVNIWFQHQGSETPIRLLGALNRVCAAGAVVWFYLYKAFCPLHLVFFYPAWDVRSADFLWWLPLIAALALTGALWWQRTIPWVRQTLFAWSYFCIALIPVMGLTDVGYMKYSLVADHYQYFAIISVVALVAAGLAWSMRATSPTTQNLARLIAGLLIIALACLSFEQNKIYADAETLYQASIAANPTSWLAHTNLGAIDLKAQKYDIAEQHFRAALAANSNYADAYYNLALAEYATSRTDAALAHLEQAIALNPKFVEAHNNLGFLLARQGKTQDAISHFEQALQYYPSYPRAHFNLAEALIALNQTDRAIEQYESALNAAPEYTEACFHLAIAYDHAGRTADAVATAQKALNLARTQQQTELAAQIESWLADYHK